MYNIIYFCLFLTQSDHKTPEQLLALVSFLKLKMFSPPERVISTVFVISYFVLHRRISFTLNNSELFEPKFGENMDKPKCWVENVIENFNPASTFTMNCIFLLHF